MEASPWTAAHALETFSLSTPPTNNTARVSVKSVLRRGIMVGEAELMRIYNARERIARKPASWTSCRGFWMQRTRHWMSEETRS